ncbi:MAG: hypothetical protein ABFS38_09355 [Bacteroidota bacterium]
MNYKTVTRGLTALLLIVLVSSFSYEAPAKKFSPVGTWEYSVPYVPEGYQEGNMIIAENGKEYSVTMAVNEYSSVEAEKVVYNKKEIKFVVWVEGQEIAFAGTFDKDKYSGTVSYSEGDFDMTAHRKKR